MRRSLSRRLRDAAGDVGAAGERLLNDVPDVAVFFKDGEDGDLDAGTAASYGFEDAGVSGLEMRAGKGHLPACD